MDSATKKEDCISNRDIRLLEGPCKKDNFSTAELTETYKDIKT